jgi:hypothetical protein
MERADVADRAADTGGVPVAGRETAVRTRSVSRSKRVAPAALWR